MMAEKAIGPEDPLSMSKDQTLDRYDDLHHRFYTDAFRATQDFLVEAHELERRPETLNILWDACAAFCCAIFHLSTTMLKKQDSENLADLREYLIAAASRSFEATAKMNEMTGQAEKTDERP